MKIALAQINPIVGDLEGNVRKILQFYEKAQSRGADLAVFPELSITGYPPRDLLSRQGFVEQNLKCLADLRKASRDVGMIVGYVGVNARLPGRGFTNSAALFQNGKEIALRDKSLLPSYDVFDEDRYFQPAVENNPIDWKGERFGLTVCEDLWNDEHFWEQRRYAVNPAKAFKELGAKFLVNISASPWNLGKNRIRHEMLQSLARVNRMPIVYCNMIGGNDELVFDGGSFVLNADGDRIAEARYFEEDLVVADLDAPSNCVEPAVMADEEKLYRALTLGLRDYLGKCGFKKAVLGLSGGIDSAVCACVAAEALGPQNVLGVSLPSQYSSQGSLDDAKDLAENLGVEYRVISIQPAFEAVRDQLKPVFHGLADDVTEENIQARLRGVQLMALSNKFGSLLLTTGNKSELAVGYCTLYGDMCGGLAVISDVPKTMVYRLSQWINRDKEIIPQSTLVKPPSAELRPDQKDQDSLPAYEILDSILEQYVVEGQSIESIAQSGVDEEIVRRMTRLINLNEYKRRQAAPGIRVTTKAFGMGRRIPIAQRYQG